MNTSPAEQAAGGGDISAALDPMQLRVALTDLMNPSGLAAEAQESWARAAVIFDDLGASEQAAEVRAERVASGIS